MINELAAVVSSLKTATDLAKLLRESKTSLEDAESRFKAAELITALADAKMQLADVQSVIARKDKRIGELQSLVTIEAQMTWDKPYYWRVEGDARTGPYCQHCYDADRKLMRLQVLRKGLWKCTGCSNQFTDGDYQPRKKPSGPIRMRGRKWF